MITIKNISKSYDKTEAIKNISLEINRGELFGLIGPDGAGKTTLMRILMTLLLPDSGKAKMDEFDVVKDFKEIRHIVGYMPGRFSLYQDLSVEENLNFFATVFGTTVEENYDLIRDIYYQIEPFKKRRAGKLSGGMKQKLALSCALIHKPKILVLDEPTTGVDAVSRKEFWEMLKKLQKKDITILVSTPYMDEAILCDQVALMQNGRILDVDSPSRITEKFPRKIIQARSENMFQLINDLRNFEKAEAVYAFGQFVHFTGIEDDVETTELDNYLEKLNHKNILVEEINPGIEDVFMNLMEK
ncbi:MAG: ABC transporter ATP-binding protein [Prolixibacteraceae bacterium]|jgi:ABC-2 type transport system ATP-binding protein|nr:ABC transporter ATP-binding protein [Prolixibacteraceae bacterium]MBT6004383.1 ABC transporter ATP-binding protein [Prolixibacteraceae bacterium]MBT6764336.1 ABC transporter ATP-binding protein [Prolixibacteraceae bacterium]MBT6998506.1 ABC transporter ATP-binding protein [Prolixibacteraceae bacterium]MBT7397147.1 ABC transporter ATP-binding protein [Prolixibacteraceae bacterium]